MWRGDIATGGQYLPHDRQEVPTFSSFQLHFRFRRCRLPEHGDFQRMERLFHTKPGRTHLDQALNPSAGDLAATIYTPIFGKQLPILGCRASTARYRGPRCASNPIGPPEAQLEARDRPHLAHIEAFVTSKLPKTGSETRSTVATELWR